MPDLLVAVQALVLCQRVGLQVAPVVLQETFRPGRRVVGGEVEHRVGEVGVAEVRPQVRAGRLGRARHAQLHAGVVAVEDARQQQALAHHPQSARRSCYRRG